MNVRRLRKMEAFLRKLPEAQFDFNDVVSEHDGKCGTVCCAIGWTPKVFPRMVKWVRTPYSGVQTKLVGARELWSYFEDIAMKLFELDFRDAEDLFSPGLNRKWASGTLTGDCTPEEVADSIDQFIAWKQAAKKK